MHCLDEYKVLTQEVQSLLHKCLAMGLKWIDYDWQIINNVPMVQTVLEVIGSSISWVAG